MCGVQTDTWTIINVHAESGNLRESRKIRETQFDQLSTLQDQPDVRLSNPDQTYVLVGDFNLRVGEDACLRKADWIPQISAPELFPGAEAHKVGGTNDGPGKQITVGDLHWAEKGVGMKVVAVIDTSSLSLEPSIRTGRSNGLRMKGRMTSCTYGRRQA